MTITTTYTDAKKQRIELATALRGLEKYDGSFVKKLGEKSKEAIRAITNKIPDAPWGQYLHAGINYKKINLNGLREEIKRLEDIIHDTDTLESCPALAEYNEALEALIAAHARLNAEAKMIHAAGRAQRLGLTSATLSF